MLKLSPRTKLKIFQYGEKVNMFLTVLNLGAIGILLLAEQPVPVEGLLSIVLNIALLFLCTTGADMIKSVHGLDDKGNFSWERKVKDKNE